ncbi:hypothetical protein QJS04_geneDACA003229 [Acorus gramineus]|uniref:Uncharacterized protein n=1 Tax=Acorus gramineus TaxID=55184 RepID=A0AAV9BT46_ACOGR|nr:hypothetical protein QJS04_geneDACA003229 [Acorus gramineus]
MRDDDPSHFWFSTSEHPSDLPCPSDHLLHHSMGSDRRLMRGATDVVGSRGRRGPDEKQLKHDKPANPCD